MPSRSPARMSFVYSSGCEMNLLSATNVPAGTRAAIEQERNHHHAFSNNDQKLKEAVRIAVGGKVRLGGTVVDALGQRLEG